MSRSEQSQPLLEQAGNGSLQEDGSTSQAQDDEARLQQKEEERFAAGASKVVNYTVWFLLAAVLIGTVVGVLLVTIPEQQGSIPGPRKSAAMVVLRNINQAEKNSTQNRRLLSENSQNEAEIVIWSGKQHHSTMPYDDLYAFKLERKQWIEISHEDEREPPAHQEPAPRWKAVSLYEEPRKAMLVQGGDPLAADGAADHYLNDLWRLKLENGATNSIWQKVDTGNGTLPVARRAHAGVITNIDGTGTPHLVIHGGRMKSGELLTDVWAISLANDTSGEWQNLWSEDDGSNDEDDIVDAQGQGNEAEANKKKHKKHKEKFPDPRKGHVAVSVPHPTRPFVVIWGGRNDTNYFYDMWAFDIVAQEWQNWRQGGKKQPSGRDHLGAFQYNGTIYIYGGRGQENNVYVGAKPIDELWAFDLETRTWEEVRVKGEKPSARFLYSMDTYTVKEPGGGEDFKLVIMGGEGEKRCYLNDVWELSLNEKKWKQSGLLKAEEGRDKCADL